MTFVDDLKAEALRLGFCLFGITNTQPTEFFPIFKTWIEAEHHATMSYLENERTRQLRAMPELILPDSRSILCVGIQYPSSLEYDHVPDQPGNIFGKVASYALGKDYHLTIPLLLEKLVTWIKNNTPQRESNLLWCAHTDSGPILERELAHRAGLGFLGKNSNLISADIGSFFFIAELFINIKLNPTDTAPDDRCGTCQRCIEACPTQCILPNRTINASRCISYLTIENKGVIPGSLRNSIGNWIFGCDICQLVCPWNIHAQMHKKQKSSLADFQTCVEFKNYSLHRDLSLTKDEFKHRYQYTAILRTKRRGYLRNIAVALGNLQGPASVPFLIKSLEEEHEPLVRGHVAWALGKIGNASSRYMLEKRKKMEPDEYVQSEIDHALKGDLC